MNFSNFFVDVPVTDDIFMNAPMLNKIAFPYVSGGEKKA